MSRKKEIIVGLDIGTTKICAVVGLVTPSGVNILGMGSHPSEGLNKGNVVNIEATVESIKKAVEEAEMMGSCDITGVITGIAGSHIKGFNSTGVIAIGGREVTQKDRDKVVDAARAVAIPDNREVIHILPQEFILDEQTGLTDPVGMNGVRLEAKVHMVTAAVANAHNIIKCCNMAGLDVDDIALQSLASAEAVLTPEDLEMGVALIDFGGGTTDMALFSRKCLRHISGVALGGKTLTTDLALGLSTSARDAENLKVSHGSAIVEKAGADDKVIVPGLGGGANRQAPRRLLAEILEPRVEELFGLLQKDIERSGWEDHLGGGVIITGGSAMLRNLEVMAAQVFGRHARVGYPTGIEGLSDIVSNPKYATAVGLVLYGARNRNNDKFRIQDKNILHRLAGRMRRWLKDIR